MRYPILLTAFVTLLLTGVYACGGGEAALAEPFSFVVISDTHVRLPGNPDDADYDNLGNINNLEDAISRINTQYDTADFVAVTGDLVGALFSENPDDYGAGDPNPAETYKTMMDQLAMPYHSVLGNHDYQRDYDPELVEGITTDNIEAIEAVWKKVLNIDPYYSLVHKGVRLVFLNPSRGDQRSRVCATCSVEAFCTGSLDEAQLDWFDAEVKAGEPVIIFMHHPPETDFEDALFAFLPSFLIDPSSRFYTIVQQHQATILGIFVGHGHIWERDWMGSVPVYETGSVGDGNGNPDNMHLVEVDPLFPAMNVGIGREGARYFSEEFYGH